MALSRRDFLASLGGLTALTASTSARAEPPRPKGTYAIVGRVLDENGTMLPHHAVLVDKGYIRDIVPASMAKNFEVFDVSPHFPNATIVPGIINCHVHRVHRSPDRRNRYLYHGVTSIGDAASPLAALPDLLHSPHGQTASAACAGPMLCPPGGYPLPVHSADHALIVSSPQQGRQRVRTLADCGATMVKFAFEPGPYPKPWPMFDPRTAHAICDEARRLGLIIRCHVEDFGGLEPALDAGVHTIEHVPHRWLTGGKIRDVVRQGEPIPCYQRLLTRMVRDDVILTPTLDVLTRSIWNGPELREPVRFFAESGGRIALGNDHPYRRTDAGMPMQEMNLLTQAGLENGAILHAATHTSAMACGMGDRGRIAPGTRADMLILRSDPQADLSCLTTPLQIIKDGVFVGEKG